jgi:hypothetical protein
VDSQINSEKNKISNTEFNKEEDIRDILKVYLEKFNNFKLFAYPW